MALNCEYCKSLVEQGEDRCGNCGAPIGTEQPLPDYRTCPFCARKLLALASPACSYCGRRLPDEYIRARESDLRRLEELKGNADAEPSTKIGEFFNESKHSRGGSSSVLGLVDVASLFDIFS